MDAVCRQYYRHRVLVVASLTGVLLCLALIHSLDRWAARHAPPRALPRQANDPAAAPRDQGPSTPPSWESEYASRVQRVRDVCDADELVAMRRVWRVATNRRFGKENFCQTRMCPVIVDEQKVLFFCFVPKVASTAVKRFLLNVSGVQLPEEAAANRTAFHAAANAALRRVSPMYFPATTANRFFKMLFVRHPFDRLVSAFRSKAELSREEAPYFYDRFWIPTMKRLRPAGSALDRPTFAEFVWMLTHTPERDFDEHWAPVWSRCDPCLVDYTFIGKLETAERDFPYAFRQVGIDSAPEWWSGEHPRTVRGQTMRYFRSVPQEEVRRLYNIYRLDFDLFGYSADEFFEGTTANGTERS